MKLRIGIIFGGTSREREISFAGGRTVYDNLNKNLFEPIPIFIDSFGNAALLNWQNIYKGSIRDFYPPASYLNTSSFQYYAENLGQLSTKEQISMLTQIGKPINWELVKDEIDFAFLCLHGTDGEDGRIQGLLSFHQIPYSGAGVFSSAVGMNKALQKELMQKLGFNLPLYTTIKRQQWLNIRQNPNEFLNEVVNKVSLPFVVKAANQGSSIGISVVNSNQKNLFVTAVDKGFFIQEILFEQWSTLNSEDQVSYVRKLTDIREGIGLPLFWKETIYNADVLLQKLQTHFASSKQSVLLEACDTENEVVFEAFLEGKEFSCIVIASDNEPVALPPTEIRKGRELFDYRAKYLPGMARKITPIELPDAQINQIIQSCEQLFNKLHFDVYARIDGFIKSDGTVYLNDPNTTSGMLPSSFFFHQAAEIGLNPSQFLTYIIRTSLLARTNDFMQPAIQLLIDKLDVLLQQEQAASKNKIRVAVMLGGYSTERHISVESGRNVFEKLASSTGYLPIPVFVSGNEKSHQLHVIPINLLLKDNADDIADKLNHYHVHPVIETIKKRCTAITAKYASIQNITQPVAISYQELAKQVDFVFIALHGRPGEDGDAQSKLEKVNLPYNGSGIPSSQITIDKFKTTEKLMQQGLLAAKHMMAYKTDWLQDANAFYNNITNQFAFPFIAKPVDDGCSSAVKMIRSKAQLEAFVKLLFRDTIAFDENAANTLKIKLNEELPIKQAILIEELIEQKDAVQFLEVTGGMLAWRNADGIINYEVFEASETLREGDVLSLEEKFLAGQGQNITPARYTTDENLNRKISMSVKKALEEAARTLEVEGYCRIDAFVRIYENERVEVVFIEVNSLPGMTPATCIFHQAAINNYKPYEFIDKIINYGFKKAAKN
jgi:UDP-N-acetylmuramate--alanine ligase